jgi:hypothetical protein
VVGEIFPVRGLRHFIVPVFPLTMTDHRLSIASVQRWLSIPRIIEELLQTIVFANSRLVTGILVTYLKDGEECSIETRDSRLSGRGGYLPSSGARWHKACARERFWIASNPERLGRTGNTGSSGCCERSGRIRVPKRPSLFSAGIERHTAERQGTRELLKAAAREREMTELDRSDLCSSAQSASPSSLRFGASVVIYTAVFRVY